MPQKSNGAARVLFIQARTKEPGKMLGCTYEKKSLKIVYPVRYTLRIIPGISAAEVTGRHTRREAQGAAAARY